MLAEVEGNLVTTGEKDISTIWFFMVIERLLEIRQLSTEEKWVLVDELWSDLLSGQPPAADPAILAELERRLAHYEAHPETATTWESLRERLGAAR